MELREVPGHRITYDYVEDEGQIIAVDVIVNGVSYQMDKVDLWKLYNIASTYFDELPLPEYDETNHQKVMEV